jgi:pyroglutamyl-peptidase
MADRPFLVTGFEPYGGRGFNPAHAVMQALHGREVGGARVEGRGLPVSFGRLGGAIAGLIDEVNPCGIICLGLWPGEPAIRLERIGINVADFEIPDNEGAICRDAPVREGVEPGRLATLPLRAIETALLAEGIPARLSATAGTFLCNACLYTVLDELARRSLAIPAGFIHIPYTPEQVAGMLADVRNSAELEIHQRADLASMELSRIVRAIGIAVAVSVESQDRESPSRRLAAR